MIALTANTKILVATQPIDFRKQFDGIIAHCRQTLQVDPRCGTVFVFANKSKTMIRALVYDANGYWLMSKRLSKGKFGRWPSNRETLSSVTARELLGLLRTSIDNNEAQFVATC